VQVFCTGNGWTRVFPMKKENEARESCSLIFHRDGVSNVTVIDGANAQVEGELRRKLHEPYTASSNVGEGGVLELNNVVGRKMLRYGYPKRCLDDCLVREAYVRSYTALDIFGLEGQVPESRVKGEPVDISTNAEYEWYEWAKFRDTSTSVPVSKVQLGRDLGAAIAIGPAMARKMMKANDDVMYRTYVRSLSPEEIESPV
jgi:hypothetical protein